jgi:hypothetical protein
MPRSRPPCPTWLGAMQRTPRIAQTFCRLARMPRMHPITLQALANFPDQLEAHYAAVPDGFQHWAPPAWDGVPSEALTALEQVCHVRDIEVDGYHVRFSRTLAEAHPVLASLDTDALVHERRYGEQDAAAALAAFRTARAKTINLLRGLAPADFERTAVFEGYGPLTLRSLVHYLCSHDQQHLAGLQWLIGKIEAARVVEPDSAVTASVD